MSDLRRRVARSRLAPLAALPMRLGVVARHDARIMRQSTRWLFSSREYTNFTYDLTERNRHHLAWWIAGVTGASVQVVRRYFEELDNNVDLRRHIQQSTATSARRGLADHSVRYGRRAGWYALVRILRPDLVVETGTDKGLGSCVLGAALLANGRGRLQTVDVHPDSGYLVMGRYAGVIERVVGDSVEVLRREREPVGMFVHDSLHTFAHETSELEAVESRLASEAIAVSDNAHATDALMRWAERTNHRFAFFRESPEGHWYPGGGIGAAWRAT